MQFISLKRNSIASSLIDTTISCSKVTVATVVYGGAVGCGLTGGYSGVLLPQLRSNTSDIFIDDDMASWIVYGDYVISVRVGSEVALTLS
ncbi:hypothetical protein C0J52_18037 [Blattella germanica]|nr:hypothetical protein C0J52_18037 [Blattella germanica]